MGKKWISKRLINKVTGLTKAKRMVAKATGIPTTRGGRQAKVGRTLGCGVCVLAFGLASAGIGLAFAQAPASEPPRITRFLDGCEARRLEIIVDSTAEMKKAQAELAELTLRTRKNPQEKERLKKSMELPEYRRAKAQAEVASCADPKILHAPLFWYHDVRVGDIGRFVSDHKGVKVLQIIDGQTMLVSALGVTFWVSGMNTAGLTDDRLVNMPVPLEAIGTKTYTTALGVNKTVMHLTPFDAAEVEPWVKIRQAQAAANAPPAKAAPPKITPKKPDRIADAAARLATAKKLSNPETRRQRLQDVIDYYPGTPAADEAAELLSK